MTLDTTSSSTLEKVRIRIAEMGPHFNQAILRDTRALYQPLLPKTSERVRVQQDVSYALDDRQCLDLYAPAEAAGLPILIYVPGGGFVGGDKRDEFGFYSNIGCYFAERGFLVLVMNYRLAPAHGWPAGGEDVGSAVAWARKHAAAHGGDPGRLAVFGQSAGASHVVTWLFDPVLKRTEPVSAVVLSSGTYRVAAGQDTAQRHGVLRSRSLCNTRLVRPSPMSIRRAFRFSSPFRSSIRHFWRHRHSNWRQD